MCRTNYKVKLDSGNVVSMSTIPALNMPNAYFVEINKIHVGAVYANSTPMKVYADGQYLGTGDTIVECLRLLGELASTSGILTATLN